MEAKDLAIGISVAFLLWDAIIIVACSRLIWSNWPLMIRWWKQDHDMQMRMSLWLAIPLLMTGLFGMRAHAMWNYLWMPACCPTTVFTQVFVYLPFILLSFILTLRWVFNRTFVVSSDQEPDIVRRNRINADRLWLAFLAFGVVLGVASTTLSYIY